MSHYLEFIFFFDCIHFRPSEKTVVKKKVEPVKSTTSIKSNTSIQINEENTGVENNDENTIKSPVFEASHVLNQLEQLRLKLQQKHDNLKLKH